MNFLPVNKICTGTVGELRVAAPSRLPGYLEECLRRGQISGDAAVITDATEISFTEADYRQIRKEFNPHSGAQLLAPGCCGG